MIDEQSSASGHDYASDRSAIGAGISHCKIHDIFFMYLTVSLADVTIWEFCHLKNAFSGSSSIDNLLDNVLSPSNLWFNMIFIWRMKPGAI